MPFICSHFRGTYAAAIILMNGFWKKCEKVTSSFEILMSKIQEITIQSSY